MSKKQYRGTPRERLHREAKLILAQAIRRARVTRLDTEWSLADLLWLAWVNPGILDARQAVRLSEIARDLRETVG